MPFVMIELACGWRFAPCFGLALLEGFEDKQCYTNHQAYCTTCAKISFRALQHIKSKVRLRCCVVKPYVYRADYNVHRTKCLTCRVVPFGKLQSDLDRTDIRWRNL